MGGGTYSESSYSNHTTLRSARGYGGSATAHSDDVRSGRAASGVHQRLNPKGLVVRESRDSDEHPASLPIAVFLDVTGSMSKMPMVAMKKLPALMGLLLTQGYAQDPQVLFGAIGDATQGDDAPLQVGQFESAIQMAEDLDAVYAEGGGGGGGEESYELAWYVAARHTALDSVEKRGKLGYLFTIGDEQPYAHVSRRQVQTLIGTGPQENVPTATILAEAQAKYHVFHLIATRGSNGRNEAMRRHWTRLLGSHAILMDDMDSVAEIIALVVGLCEGTVDIDRARRDLVALGIAAAAVDAVVEAVGPVAAGMRAIRLSDEA